MRWLVQGDKQGVNGSVIPFPIMPSVYTVFTNASALLSSKFPVLKCIILEIISWSNYLFSNVALNNFSKFPFVLLTIIM